MTGRDRRLLAERDGLRKWLEGRTDILCRELRWNRENLPTAYEVEYRIKSLCGIREDGHPLFAERFLLRIDLPEAYPDIDAPPSFRFLTCDEEGNPIPHPWHPNIRYSGDFAGRVCLNAMDTHAGLAWAVERVESYLRYERYHALNEAPYPEDQRVAAWVIREGEPNDWIVF